MIPKFAVVDELARENFEKEWQIVYGYGNCFVSYDVEEAIRYMEERVSKHETSYIVEKIDFEGRETIYRR